MTKENDLPDGSHEIIQNSASDAFEARHKMISEAGKRENWSEDDLISVHLISIAVEISIFLKECGILDEEEKDSAWKYIIDSYVEFESFLRWVDEHEVRLN